MLTTFLVTTVVLLILIAMIAVRIILIKGGEFHGSCSSNNPFTKREGGRCTLCGATSEESCARTDADETPAKADSSESTAGSLVKAEEQRA